MKIQRKSEYFLSPDEREAFVRTAKRIVIMPAAPPRFLSPEEGKKLQRFVELQNAHPRLPPIPVSPRTVKRDDK